MSRAASAEAPIRVLLVDDAPEMRLLVRTALRLRGGFEVVGEAGRGDSAVELAHELAPDVIVLDLVLPDVGGRDVLLNLQEAAPAADVVIFSGLDPEDPAWFEDRARGYVVKGDDVERLVEVIGGVGDPDGVVEAAVQLPRDLASVGEARAFVRSRLEAWGLGELMDLAYLVVSELAANAITHADSHYELSVVAAEHGVRIAVRDYGPGMPAPGPPQLSDEHGRGLLLVSAMSSAWGVEHREVGKVVWAELRREQDAVAD
ncbi:response regulator [Nocardioides sp. zg-536]|uniref:Response regulator n=1 Tax=Nocardioides faecalis TaxID=2803858 RepID=A0A938YC11_9ACTN|nr:response regulator [Nocardioides faecalis]MBM9461580.1 response regulator [Nocardioides faecalis]MBS4752510.1 response regulator [Nocardioides faecalis]QVI57787.1 response regulator [Nocardioides faecalis]